MLHHQVPEGQPVEDGQSQGYGRAVRIEEIELEIGVDGRIGRCRVTRLDSRPEAALPLPTDTSSCPFYEESDIVFDAAEEGSGPRRLRLLTAIYLDRRSGN